MQFKIIDVLEKSGKLDQENTRAIAELYERLIPEVVGLVLQRYRKPNNTIKDNVKKIEAAMLAIYQGVKDIEDSHVINFTPAEFNHLIVEAGIDNVRKIAH